MNKTVRRKTRLISWRVKSNDPTTAVGAAVKCKSLELQIQVLGLCLHQHFFAELLCQAIPSPIKPQQPEEEQCGQQSEKGHA